MHFQLSLVLPLSILAVFNYDFCTGINILLRLHPAAPRVHQLEGNTCEITWETIPPMRGDPISYVLQVLVGRESEYRQVCLTHTHTHTRVYANPLTPEQSSFFTHI